MAKNKITLFFNGTDFNCDFAATQTEQEFLDYWTPVTMLNLKLADRKEVLKEAYRLCLQKVGSSPAPAISELPAIPLPESNKEVVQEGTVTEEVVEEQKKQKQKPKGGE